jgi:Cu/Ag efflux protein CusF
MQWPRMTMGFLVEDKSQLGKLNAGDTVEFRLRGQPDKDGSYVIERIAPAGGK